MNTNKYICRSGLMPNYSSYTNPCKGNLVSCFVFQEKYLRSKQLGLLASLPKADFSRKRGCQCLVTLLCMYVVRALAHPIH